MARMAIDNGPAAAAGRRLPPHGLDAPSAAPAAACGAKANLAPTKQRVNHAATPNITRQGV